MNGSRVQCGQGVSKSRTTWRSTYLYTSKWFIWLLAQLHSQGGKSVEQLTVDHGYFVYVNVYWFELTMESIMLTFVNDEHLDCLPAPVSRPACLDEADELAYVMHARRNGTPCVDSRP